MAGFKPIGRLSDGGMTVRDLKSADTALAIGDLVNLESQVLDLAATNDSALLGAVIGPAKAADGSLTDLASIGASDRVSVVIDADMVYEVTDANARVTGDTLDIAGATGAQGVASSSNTDVMVIADSTATEPTLVMIMRGSHRFGL